MSNWRINYGKGGMVVSSYTMTRHQVLELLEVARRLSLTGASALLAAGDADRCYRLGDLECAAERALDSLGHSVGTCHPEYQRWQPLVLLQGKARLV